MLTPNGVKPNLATVLNTEKQQLNLAETYGPCVDVPNQLTWVEKGPLLHLASMDKLTVAGDINNSPRMKLAVALFNRDLRVNCYFKM